MFKIVFLLCLCIIVLASSLTTSRFFKRIHRSADVFCIGDSSTSSDIPNEIPPVAIDDIRATSPVTNDEGPLFPKKKIIASLSAVIASVLFVFQHSQPASSVALLKAMEKDSVTVKEAVCNDKPTLIEFYADWCESCKAMAPSMRSIEQQYKGQINFITVDGSSAKPYNSELVRRFRVDGIPHVAFITPNNEVKTALVGAIPKKILDEDVTALLQNKPLPYEGYDAFEEQSHFPLNDIPSYCPVAEAAKSS